MIFSYGKILNLHVKGLATLERCIFCYSNPVLSRPQRLAPAQVKHVGGGGSYVSFDSLGLLHGVGKWSRELAELWAGGCRGAATRDDHVTHAEASACSGIAVATAAADKGMRQAAAAAVTCLWQVLC